MDTFAVDEDHDQIAQGTDEEQENEILPQQAPQQAPKLDDQVDTQLRTHAKKTGKQPRTGTKRKSGALSQDQVLSAMDSTKFTQGTLANTRDNTGPQATSLGGKLDQSTHQQTMDKRQPSTETMRQRVQMMMTQYQSRFAGGHTSTTNNAMLIAMAIQGAARIIADEMYDPVIEPQIAEKMAELHAPELRKALPDKTDGGTTHRKDAIKLAQVLVSGDPVARFMHDEMRLDHAVAQIQKMANAAPMTAEKMFKLLREKWEAEMASYTLDTVSARHMASNQAYNTREATGEMSTEYMKRLFPDIKGTEAPPAAKDNKHLELGGDAKAKLSQLESAVSVVSITPPTQGGIVDGVNLTGKQMDHLKEVGDADTAVLTDRVDQVVHYLTNKGFNGKTLSDSEARKVVAKLQSGMMDLPLTVTVKGHEWFGEGKSVDKLDPVFRPGSSRRNEASMAEVVGKPEAKKDDDKVKYLGEWKGEASRGKDYLRFRTWKDQRMTSHHGLSDEEMPAFGALNANWNNTQGTGAYASDMSEAYKQGTGQSIHETANNGHGINYYGDVHFMLDKAKVQNRLVYTGTDHGTPHKNPFLVLADMLLGDGTNYKASKTGVEASRLQQDDRAGQLINAALGGEMNFKRELPFELQIFGGIDLRRDVQAIHVSSNLPPLVAQRLMAAQDKLPVPIKVIEPPKSAPVYVANQMEMKDQLHALMKKEGA